MLLRTIILTFVGFAYTLDAPKISNIWATEPPGLFVKWDNTFYKSITEVTGFKWPFRYYVSRFFTIINPPSPMSAKVFSANLPSHADESFVSVWKVEMSSNEKFDLVNADQFPGLIRDDFPLEEYNLNSTLSSSPRVINVSGRTQESALIKDVEYNTIYEVRIQGLKGDKESPLSEPRRIKIVKGEGYHAILQKLPTGCLLSVPSFVTAVGETYPFVQNSFY